MPSVTASRFDNLTGAPYRLLMAVPQDIADIVNQMRQQRLKICSDTRLSQQGMNADLSDARQTCMDAVNELVQQAESHKADIDKAVAEVFEGSPDVQAQLLEQISRQRCWERIKRLLDSRVSPKDLISQAGASGDALTLRTLREELPAYYGVPSGVGSIHSAADGYSEVPELLDTLDAAELPLLDPVERTARTLSQDVARGFTNGVLAAQNYALYELSGKGEAPYIPAWDGSAIDLENGKIGGIRISGRL